jgi:hypothetical protein
VERQCIPLCPLISVLPPHSSCSSYEGSMAPHSSFTNHSSGVRSTPCRWWHMCTSGPGEIVYMLRDDRQLTRDSSARTQLVETLLSSPCACTPLPPARSSSAQQQT